ncbi:QcrA and Rieske domain-containing protein [Bremerella sp. T1]|uniref:QcrA and Rieske domain-containing protein n=1 Tax=Bremerella sp. TYQ1 TaxID=3119568 RepID=UPI001CCBE04E|nr:ubiquinol-cytochrome c reductase iron-sulfur subunit [Bremerella volcania]UBM37344.1 ubiquinol-cytochrome c reductase iron-sulfur subunit [Bremerella volcania]
MSEVQPSPPTAEDDDRRGFLTKLSMGLSALIGLGITLPGIGFVLAPVFRREKHVWRRLDKLDAYEVGKTVSVEFTDSITQPWAGVTALTGAWLRRVSDEEFIAFSINCRHLGCPVNWVEDASLFMCPCHGGVYYEDGEVAAGPPPEPLARYQVRVRDGFVEIETSSVPLTTNDQV